MTDLDGIESRLAKIEQLLKETQKVSRWIDLREMVEYSGLSDSTLRRLVSAGKLKCSKQSGKLLFRTIWVDKFLMFGKVRLTPSERRELEGIQL